MDDDDYIQSLPLLDERGYEIVVEDDGEEVLDENGDPVIFDYGATIVADLW